MTNYALQFFNQTDDEYTIALFAELDNPDQVAVAAVCRRVPRNGAAGLQWTMQWNVGIAQCEDGKLYSSATSPTEPGRGWDVIFEDAVQRLVPASHHPGPDQIAINNQSGHLVNAGVGMTSGALAYVTNLLSGTSAHFYVPIRIALALFTDIEQGEVVTPLKMVAGPLRVEFPDGVTSGTVIASMSGDDIDLELTYDLMQLKRLM